MLANISHLASVAKKKGDVVRLPNVELGPSRYRSPCALPCRCQGPEFDPSLEQETALGLHQQVLAGFAAIGHPMMHRSAGHVISLLQETGRSDEAEAIAREYGVNLATSPNPKAGDQVVPEVHPAPEVQ